MRHIALALALALAPAAALAATLGVPLDQSVRIGLRTQAHDVIVGNPAIADVTVADPHHLIVTGKMGGVTNLIVTDAVGRTIFDRQIVVSASTGDHVALIKGPEVVSYACAPSCAVVSGGPSAVATASGGGAAPYSTTAPAPATSTPVSASPMVP